MDPIEPPTSYVFRMDCWEPGTLPVKRLAQYLEKLAVLFGEPESVHFVKLRPGSTRQFLKIDPPAAAHDRRPASGAGRAQGGR